MPEWERVGLHRYYTDGDVVFWDMVGTMDQPEIERLLEQVEKVLSRFTYSVLLVDCTHGHHLTPEARRRYAEWLRTNQYPNRASIFFNVTGEMHTFLKLAARGGELLSGKRSAIEIVTDEKSAWQRAAAARADWATTYSA